MKLINLLKKNKIKIKKDIFYIFNLNEEYDTRISKKSSQEYQKKIQELKLRIKNKVPVKIIIAISRYNFFELHKIAGHLLDLFGEKVDLSWIKFKALPMTQIVDKFNNYVNEVKSHLPVNIKLKLYDKELEEILIKFQELALQNADSESELARLLGVICENAFVGPRVMVIDPHHRCNTNCTHCWVHTPGVNHDSEFLNRTFPMDRFKKMIDDASDLKVETIILQGDGEPLLHPHSIDMLKYARSKNIDVRFFTNAILLNEKVAKEVVDIGVKEIYCSIPAGTPETYKIINPIQKKETYHKVVANLKKLMEIKRAAKAKDPRVIVTHVIHTQNHHELIRMAKDDVYEKVDAVRFYLIRLDEMNQFLQLSKKEIEKIKQQIPDVEKILKKGNVEFVDNIKFQLENYNSKDGSWSKDVFLKHGCTIGYYFNLVPAKGDMSFCCHLRTVGDLSKESFKDIWQHERYRKWRYHGKYMDEFKDEKFLNDHPLYDEDCTHCDNHQTILESYDKLKRYGLWSYYK